MQHPKRRSIVAKDSIVGEGVIIPSSASGQQCCLTCEGRSASSIRLGLILARGFQAESKRICTGVADLSAFFGRTSRRARPLARPRSVPIRWRPAPQRGGPGETTDGAPGRNMAERLADRCQTGIRPRTSLLPGIEARPVRYSGTHAGPGRKAIRQNRRSSGQGHH